LAAHKKNGGGDKAHDPAPPKTSQFVKTGRMLGGFHPENETKEYRTSVQ
jgi:hypothetical protein